MKKFLLVLVSMYIVTTAIAQKTHFVITGKIEGADGVTFTLQKFNGIQIMSLDTVIALKGVFKITGGSVEYPEMAELLTLDKKKQLFFFLENKNITITGKLDSLNKATVTGSKTQDELVALNGSLKTLEKRYNQLGVEYQEATKANDAAKTSSLTKQINELMQEANTIEKSFIKKHPSSFVVPGLLTEIMNVYNPDELEEVIKSLSPEVAKTQAILDIKSKLASLRITDIGQKAPDFTMNDVNGKKISLSSKTGSKLLLIDFWAGWCSPCRKENPNVVKVYNEFHEKGFDIIGVSLDRTEADWKKAIADDNLTWTHVSDLKYWNNEAARLYSVVSIPANFLLDKNGVIVAKNLRGEELYNKVKELINK